MKWVCSAFAIALACAWALSISTASAQSERDPLIAPGEGAAGSRFQVVGQTGWTPGETVTLEFTFADTDPGASPNGPFFHQREITVLRDGTWSFPVAVNNELFPFPLWRPGFIVVRATSGTHSATNVFAYTVEGRRPAGYPPLAELGSGPMPSPTAAVAGTAALFAAGIGALLAASGAIRRRTGGN